MQVVYSGGSNTPTPSPRLQRKMGYGRPVMPGYMTHVHPQVLVQRSREKLTEGDTTLRDSIPAMSTCVASLCLVLNIFIPGSGTLTAGLSVLCCSRVRPKGGTKRHCILLNAGVALMQFLLTFLFLLGWIWSINWGVAFLTVSNPCIECFFPPEKCQRKEADDRSHGKSRDKSSYSPNSSPSKKPNRSGHNHQHQYQRAPHHHHYHHHHHHSPKHQHSKADSSPRSRQGDSPRPASSRELTPKSSPDVRRLPNNNLENVKSLTPDSSKRGTVASQDNEPATLVPPQPIIVLQKAPEIGAEGVEEKRHSAPNETIMQARTRHMKMLQRQMSDNDLSPFVLTNQQLEAIVIHDLPVVNSNIRPNSNHSNGTEETANGLPKL